jgi:hydroxyethylthiazole kinase-like uncharacterized protein yjeF
MNPLNSDRISSKEMAILDDNSEWLGIPKSLLMECAGYGFAIEILKKYQLDEYSKVLIFCGTGNNGGDGFVIARHLNSFGIRSIVTLIGDPSKIRTKEAKMNWEAISKNLDEFIQIQIITDSTDVVNFGLLLNDQTDIKLIVDAMLGTGIKGNIREPIATAIEFINEIRHQRGIPVASVDVPSGLDPDTGEGSNKVIHADLVITFHRNKLGMHPKTEFIDELIVKSIGIPQEASVLVGRGDFLATLKRRKKDNHKGQYGRLLIIGGSKNYSGAPAYSSLTAIEFGIDLTITFTPGVIGDVVRSYSPNMIVRTSPGDWLNAESYKEIIELMEWANTVIIGPGLGQERQTEELLVTLIEKVRELDLACVLDADALKLIKNHLKLIKGLRLVITPHAGELKIMTGLDLPPYDDVEKRSQILLELGKKLDVTLLIKGPYDYITDGKTLKINKTGCPEMSIGGTGDVLAGLCGCLLAIGNEPFESACSAAFLNGFIGQHVKEKIGPHFTTIDLIDHINRGILELTKYQV